MTEYGLPNTRDKDGELQAIDHTYDFDGEEITIKFRPPTVSEFERIEEIQQQADVDPSELEDLLREFLCKPEIPEDDSFSFREMMAYLEGIVQYSTGGGGMQEEARAELEQHLDAEGN